MSFEVSIDVFEGPLDLLLHLIMKQELAIHEVSISKIAESFIEYIRNSETLNLDIATEFLLIAATLLLIKTRSLIPIEEEEAEQEEEDDPGEILVERLIEYKKFSNVADFLELRNAEHGWYVPRMRELEEDYSSLYPDPFENTSTERLVKALASLLVEWVEVTVDVSHMAPIRVSVSEQIERIRGIISRNGRTSFSELAEGCLNRIQVIATFLAVLELSKRREMSMHQDRLFGEIILTPLKEGQVVAG